MAAEQISRFDQLALAPELLAALNEVGYEVPSPIQARTIPPLLHGRDVVGQAQTGTGKTAAFALPVLSRLEKDQSLPQVLVLTPTRELAIQVAEAFRMYAKHLKNFHVLPVYGGQDYRIQIRALERGVQVVVGTPGRIMDHMNRGTLKLDQLRVLVLDEADEMLRMGFIDDVEWILQKTPQQRQTALFSATMAAPIRRIANRYLTDPEEITIKEKSTTAETIRQRFWLVSGVHKLDALTRILEAEPFDAMLVFVRTKTATLELAEKLDARGFACAALNGDIPQKQREKTVAQLKSGALDIVVATDVAARGLDVDRISHVINYDIPYDAEAYVHRIGRTGRAGRAGDAILFVTPREKRLLKAIEQATRKPIEKMVLPTAESINDRRIEKFKQRITDTLATDELSVFCQIIEEYQQEHNVPAEEIAAALAKLLQGETPLLLRQNAPVPETHVTADRKKELGEKKPKSAKQKTRRQADTPAYGMESFRLEVGREDGVKPANLVGAIANEAGIDNQYIGKIEIHADYSTIDLPEGMPKEIFNQLRKVWVAGKQLRISRLQAQTGSNTKTDKRSGRKKQKTSKPKSKPASQRKQKKQRRKKPPN